MANPANSVNSTVESMDVAAFPEMILIQQRFPRSPAVDFGTVLQSEFTKSQVLANLRPGSRVAVGIGSRGISNLQRIVTEVIRVLRAAGLEPFIVPAMGSHGGATPEGQTDVLASFGVTEKALGVPIDASMETQYIGETSEGIPVFVSSAALKADGIVLVNRVKAHTDFTGTLGSGILKMVAIGLGKRDGATACHAAASRVGHERVIRSVSRVMLARTKILGGVAILENQQHETHTVEVLPPSEVEQREAELLQVANAMMPRLPFSDVDLLIVDRMGKDISGAGMDPHVVGRSVQGYSSSLVPEEAPGSVAQRIFVRELTPATNGNGIGIGLADFARSDLVRGIDFQKTYINALTALTPQTVKVPIHFETDREIIALALRSVALSDGQAPRIARIADTLSLEYMQVSAAFRSEVERRSDLVLLAPPRPMEFDASGNLLPMGPFAAGIGEQHL